MQKIDENRFEEMVLKSLLDYLRDEENPLNSFFTIYEDTTGKIKVARSSSPTDRPILNCKIKLRKYAIRTDEKIEGKSATITLSPIRYK